MPDKEELNSMYTPCEICSINPAAEMKGGINPFTNERGMWLCCKDCFKLIEDNRKGERRNGR
jgi:hypothetical protein